MKCPTCRRLDDSELTRCPRCGTDFTLLIEVENYLKYLINQGNQALKTNALEEAEHSFNQALRISSETTFALKGLALTALLSKDYKKALSIHKQLRT